ncbi:hypothetical protein [Halovivax cerinus]|uniref:Uncharacterized protein n=1 Tax=Halovivax cerinus TaxID=1487865 RepID=A0ABD5NLX1_9EURY|nr:hypothetical protein [Halovivax cerinus]
MSDANRSSNDPDPTRDGGAAGTEPRSDRTCETMSEETEHHDRTEAETHRPDPTDASEGDARAAVDPTPASDISGPSANGRSSGGDTPRRVKDRDHTSPVEGPERTFDRYHEGRSARTDGGRRRSTDDPTDASESPSDNDETPRRVKDRDHTSPVDGHVRTFGRGGESSDRSK